MKAHFLFLVVVSILSLSYGANFTPEENADKVKETKIKIPDGITIGIESITKIDDTTATIAIYLIADKPVAGFQMEVAPKDKIQLT